MEGTHRKLCTGLTDRLSCYDTYCFTDLNSLAGSHVRAVAFCTDTVMAAAGKYRTYLNAFRDHLARIIHFVKQNSVAVNAFFKHTLGTAGIYHMILLNKNLTLCILDIFTRITSEDTILKLLYRLLAVLECLNIHSGKLVRAFTAIALAYDEFL